VTGRGRPATIVRITADGRTRFLAYIDELESVVRDVHQRSGETPAFRDGWAAQS
jgi:predicted ArsR family transcriptional regulator